MRITSLSGACTNLEEGLLSTDEGLLSQDDGDFPSSVLMVTSASHVSSGTNVNVFSDTGWSTLYSNLTVEQRAERECRAGSVRYGSCGGH